MVTGDLLITRRNSYVEVTMIDGLVRSSYTVAPRRILLVYMGPSKVNGVLLSWVMFEDGHVSRITDGDIVPA